MTKLRGRAVTKERDQRLAEESEIARKVQEMRQLSREAAQRHLVEAARVDFMAFVKHTMPDPAAPGTSRYKNARHHDAIAATLEQVEKGEIRQLILTMPPRHGKLCADEVDVPTPTGFKKHGALRVGDDVFDRWGKPVRVVAVGERAEATLRVRFTNGDEVCVHPNHEWFVYDRRRGRWCVAETREIADEVWLGTRGGRGGRARWQLPDVLGVEFAERDLLLDPYVLGAWLGDGSVGKSCLNMAASDQAVWERVAQAVGENVVEHAHAETGVVNVAFGIGTPGVQKRMTRFLKTVGVLWRKHIPENYLRSSRTQRLELLAGLMDTDGHVEANTGRCRIVSVFPELVAGVVDLCASLGFRPYVSQQEPALSSSGIQGRRTVFTVGFQPFEAIPTSLPRRRVGKFAMRRRVAVAAVEACAPELGRCIQVDSDDGLYLVGRTYLPTHNSELTTRKFPAWYVGRNPRESVVVATYNDILSQDFGRDVRTVMQTAQFKQTFPAVKLKQGSQAADRLQTEQGGQLSFVGRGGSLTGRGAHVLIIDDLIKDHEEARSPAVRDAAWNWLTKVAMTRRMGKKLVIIIMTRWHSDDPIGRLTDPENSHYSAIEASKWKIIDLPAIANEDDPLGRAPGEPLWPDGPDQFDLEFLASQQRLDPLGFAALYQQRPSAADGTLFKREYLQFYDPEDLPENLRKYGASDHAVSTQARRDYTVLGTAGTDRQNNLYLLDVFWERAESIRVVEQMLMMGQERSPLVWWAERGHISKSIGPFLRKRMAETGIFFNVDEVQPIGDKEQRAQSFAARMAQGRVFLPRKAPWVDRAVAELLAFPNGTHDDFVDMCSLLGLGLRSQFGSQHKPKAPEPRFGTLGWLKRDAELMRKHQDGDRRGF